MIQQRSFTTNSEDDLNKELKIFDFSHYLLPAKERGVVRLFYNNVNRLEINGAINARIASGREKTKHKILKHNKTYTKVEALIKQVGTWGVNITALAEPCIEWRDTVPRTVVKEIAKKYNKFGHWTVATSSCSVGSFVKPGGALLYNDGELSGRIMTTGTDPWCYGRWAYSRYRGKHNTSLLVVVGYRVGTHSGNAGPSTAWYQQKVLLTKDACQIEPEEAFIKDMED